ncbi:hypothetical protein [Paeniclostridium hominis]|uniref:hypothetical protein n=1 Tax=Paeniclostridium hominis TaxID=2764329 RepID=UPI0022E0DC17|nr:hypothetical protein [Paeniclostridium hominis]
MLKKLLNFIKINKENKTQKEEVEVMNIKEKKDNIKKDNQNIDQEITSKSEIKKEHIEEEISENLNDIKQQTLTKEEDYIKLVKIQREKKIKAIDVYTNEETIFETYKECSKKLGVPIEYIKENLQYGYTDYFGEAIKFLNKKVKVDLSHKKLGNMNIVEVFNFLHNELWNSDMPEGKREEILLSNKIEPIHMYYKFESMDYEYDDYFKIYGKIIRRGGKKRIELIDKKNEVIEVFKSIEDCAKFFEKDKSEIVYRLKLGNCKIGRYEIKYSLRR